MQAQIDREQQELAHARLMMLERAKELANPGDEEGTDATDVARSRREHFVQCGPRCTKPCVWTARSRAQTHSSIKHNS